VPPSEEALINIGGITRTINAWSGYPTPVVVGAYMNIVNFVSLQEIHCIVEELEADQE